MFSAVSVVFIVRLRGQHHVTILTHATLRVCVAAAETVLTLTTTVQRQHTHTHHRQWSRQTQITCRQHSQGTDKELKTTETDSWFTTLRNKQILRLHHRLTCLSMYTVNIVLRADLNWSLTKHLKIALIQTIIRIKRDQLVHKLH